MFGLGTQCLRVDPASATLLQAGGLLSVPWFAIYLQNEGARSSLGAGAEQGDALTPAE